MPWKTSVLVVANVTADSDEVLAEMSARAERGPVAFTLLVPAGCCGTEGRDVASVRLTAAIERMHASGLQVNGLIGDSDPLAAVHDAWDPRKFDEVIVATLPTRSSKWFMVDLPHRIERITDVRVTHVVASERRRPFTGMPVPARERPGVLAPLAPLGWGRSDAP